jgi:hypothetical protein
MLGFAAVIVVWRIAKVFGDGQAVFWTVLLLTISPLQIWYSQESRAYALYFLMAAISFWFFFRALDTNRLTHWILYGVAAACGLYTHYFFSILILCNATIVLIEKARRGGLRNAVLGHIGMGILGAGVFWLLKDDLECQAAYYNATSFGIAALGYTFWAFLVGFSTGPSVRELHSMPAIRAASQSIPWIIAVGTILSILGYWGFKALRKERRWLGRVLILLLSVPFCGFLTSMFGVGFKVQYVVWALIPFLLLLGQGLSAGKGQKAMWCFLGILCLVQAVSLFNRHYVDRYKNEDMRAVATYIKSQSSTVIPVLVMAGYMAPLATYYLGNDWPVVRVKYDGRSNSQLNDAMKQIEDLPTGMSGFWFIYTREFHGDPAGLIKESLLDRGMIRLQSRFPGIELYSGEKAGL